MRKWLQIAGSWTLYGIGLAAFWALERVGLRYEARPEPPWFHTVLWHVYQWCMVTSSHLDEWDVLWKSPLKGAES